MSQKLVYYPCLSCGCGLDTLELAKNHCSPSEVIMYQCHQCFATYETEDEALDCITCEPQQEISYECEICEGCWETEEQADSCCE